MRTPFALSSSALLVLALAVAHTSAAQTSPPASAPPLRVLSGEEFGRYLKALDSLMDLRRQAQKQLRDDSGAEAGADASAQTDYTARSRDALKDNGFSAESWSAAHWNVMQAFAQLELQANTAAVESALREQRAELARAKPSLAPGVYAERRSRIESTEALLRGTGGIPEANLELVRGHLSELKATFERGMEGVQSGYQPGGGPVPAARD